MGTGQTVQDGEVKIYTMETFLFRVVLGLSWFNWWVSFAPDFQCCFFCDSSCLLYLNFDFYVSKEMHL